MIRAIVAFCLLSFVCVAQVPKATAPPDHFLLSQINATGSQRYSKADIVAALQLKTGTQVSQKDLQDASQRLGNSGLFQLVKYEFGWQGNGVVATFDLADATSFVPVGFENFVWFTPGELIRRSSRGYPCMLALCRWPAISRIRSRMPCSKCWRRAIFTALLRPCRKER